MSEPFLSEIKIFSFLFAPKGWAFCNGQLMPINQNQALFALLGTTYGGDGRQTFALPNLQGRIPLHVGSGYLLGQAAGEQSHTLTLSELAGHVHPANCNSAVGTQTSPAGNFWAQDNNGNAPYSTAAGATMAPGAISTVGGGVGGTQPHENRAPFLALSFCIALQGIFPTQN